MIYGDNSMDDRGEEAMTYLTGVVVNVTTTNDDGSTTYQILSINNETLKQVGNICVCMRACVRACVRVCVCVCVTVQGRGGLWEESLDVELRGERGGRVQETGGSLRPEHESGRPCER